MEGVSVSTLVQSVGDVFTAAMGWVGDVFSEMATNPVLLLFCIGLRCAALLSVSQNV